MTKRKISATDTSGKTLTVSLDAEIAAELSATESERLTDLSERGDVERLRSEVRKLQQPLAERARVTQIQKHADERGVSFNQAAAELSASGAFQPVQASTIEAPSRGFEHEDVLALSKSKNIPYGAAAAELARKGDER